MRKEEAEEGNDRMGKKREYCLDDLLETLLEGSLGLNGIVKRINEDKFAGAVPSPSYHKNTVLKNIHYAVDNKLIKYVPVDRKGVGSIRRPLCLTAKGRKRAERNRITNAICVLSDKDFQSFVSSHKMQVVREIVSYFNDRAVNAEFYNGGNNEKDDNLIEGMLVRAEADLRLHGFKEDEIVQMWLINRGELVLRVIEKFSGPTFFGSNENISELKYTEEEKLFIQGIKQQLTSYLKK